MSRPTFRSIVTVTLNPTIDRIIEVPGFHVGGHLQGRLHLREPAGKAINVSRALAALGVANTAIGWVGMQTYDLFHESLARAGVKACFLPIAGETRENITLIDPQGGAETHIRDAGPTITPADVQRLIDLLESVSTPQTLVVFTGSLPGGVDMAVWCQLLDMTKRRGAHVAVDISGEALRAAADAGVWLVKPNEKELADLTGHAIADDQALLAAGKTLQQRIPVLPVTMGSRGAFCFTEEGVFRGCAALNPGEVRSTVGCGDAFLAGLLAALIKPEATFTDALQDALAVSAAAALQEQPATFDMHDFTRLREQTQVQHIE